MLKRFFFSVCLLSQLSVCTHASETSRTYLFDSNPSSDQSGPVEAAAQLGYYAANFILIQKCDIQRHHARHQWENHVAVGILDYGWRYQLSDYVRHTADMEAQRQLTLLLHRGKVPVDRCRNAETMFKKALSSNMEPPNGTLASSAAEAKNEALVEVLKAGFSGSIRSGRKILPFSVDHIVRTDHHNFEAIMNWPKSGAANVIKGRVSGNEQLAWKETVSRNGKTSRECEYILNRRSLTSMAGGWGKCSRGGFVEITFQEPPPIKL